MSDVFAELDEVMRQERLAKFWHEHGTTIIVFVVLTIVATAGFSTYKTWNAHMRERQTQILLETIEAKDFPANLDLESLKLRDGLESIAALQAGAKLLEEDKPDEALTYYEALANNKDAPEDFRDLGILMTARLKASKEDADTAALITLLKPIADRTDSPWRYYAHLDMAILLANGTKDYDAALKHLNFIVISQKALPAGLNSKAGALQHVYELKRDKVKAE